MTDVVDLCESSDDEVEVVGVIRGVIEIHDDSSVEETHAAVALGPLVRTAPPANDEEEEEEYDSTDDEKDLLAWQKRNARMNATEQGAPPARVSDVSDEPPPQDSLQRLPTAPKSEYDDMVDSSMQSDQKHSLEPAPRSKSSRKSPSPGRALNDNRKPAARASVPRVSDIHEKSVQDSSTALSSKAQSDNNNDDDVARLPSTSPSCDNNVARLPASSSSLASYLDDDSDDDKLLSHPVFGARSHDTKPSMKNPRANEKKASPRKGAAPFMTNAKAPVRGPLARASVKQSRPLKLFGQESTTTKRRGRPPGHKALARKAIKEALKQHEDSCVALGRKGNTSSQLNSRIRKKASKQDGRKERNFRAKPLSVLRGSGGESTTTKDVSKKKVPPPAISPPSLDDRKTGTSSAVLSNQPPPRTSLSDSSEKEASLPSENDEPNGNASSRAKTSEMLSGQTPRTASSGATKKDENTVSGKGEKEAPPKKKGPQAKTDVSENVRPKALTANAAAAGTDEDSDAASAFSYSGSDSDSDDMEFSETMDSDDKLVSLPSDADIPLATRKSRKAVVNYSEPGDIKMTKSEEYVLSDSEEESEGETEFDPSIMDEESRTSKDGDAGQSSNQVSAGSQSEGDTDCAQSDSLSVYHSPEMQQDMPFWSRKTRNKNVNYREPGDVVKMTPSQEYLLPKKHVEQGTKKRKRADENVTSDASSKEAAPKRKRGRPRKSKATPKEIQVRPGRIEYKGDKGSYAIIPHLTKVTFDANGCPTTYMSVLGSCETIYDLVVTVKKSKIPGAGWGAFLKFLGARVLNKERQAMLQERQESGDRTVLPTDEPLEARTRDGLGLSVHIKADSLCTDEIRRRKSEEGVPLLASFPSGKTVNVKLSGDGMPFKRIGSEGVHTELDYEDSNFRFSTKEAIVDIGRYGPVLKTDRKPEFIYDIKSCIFLEPAEWGFGVSEKIYGWEERDEIGNVIHDDGKQMIDITDDATGERHAAAMRLAPSYVNEVGHSPDLKANVHALEKDNRAVHYYVELQKSLAKGEEVELFTDYDDVYETVRERKGYGIANVHYGVKGDDHEPSRLLRNFEKRNHMVDDIKDKNIRAMKVFVALEFVFHRILCPVVEVTDNFLQGQRDTEPIQLQWIARLRMDWLGKVFEAQIAFLLRSAPGRNHAFPYKGILEQARKWASQMRWNTFGETFCLLRSQTEDPDLSRVYKTLRVASREEILYQLSKRILKPLDSSVWCPVAQTLLTNLCDCTARYWSAGAEANHKLQREYLELAQKASRQIRRACRERGGETSDVVFTSGVTREEKVGEGTLEALQGFIKDSRSFLEHSTFPKGIIASLVEFQTSRDSSESTSLRSEASKGSLAVNSSTKVLIACKSTGDAQTDDATNAGDVFGCPRLLPFFEAGGQLNEEWYLLWQVVYVVAWFASTFAVNGNKQEKADRSDAFLRELCSVADVDVAKARAVLTRGMVVREYKSGSKQPAVSRVCGSPRKKAPKEASKRKFINRQLFDAIIWKTLTAIGWKLDTGNRPKDFYYLPPGVERRRGFSNRTDYFDSVPLVVEFIKSDPRWKDRKEIVECLELFDKLMEKKDAGSKVDSLLRELEQK